MQRELLGVQSASLGKTYDGNRTVISVLNPTTMERAIGTGVYVTELY